MRRLSRAGFKKEFVSGAILPDWWDAGCSEDSGLLPEIEIRVARFLGIPASAVADPTAPLAPAAYQGAHLRRVRDIDRDRLGPAIHAALRIAGAAVRNLDPGISTPRPLPSSGLAWRKELPREDDRVSLDDVLRDLWTRGVPVIPVEVLPTPSFQGLAAVVEDRPVIVLGHRHDEPGRVAFFLGHEAGHIAAGDCAPGSPVVDQDEEIAAGNDMEGLADRYATELLVGSPDIPQIGRRQFDDFRDLAREAARLERDTGADAGAILFAWARATEDFPTATMAAKALYRDSGARGRVRAAFEKFVDLTGASETDRELLRSVVPDAAGSDAVAG